MAPIDRELVTLPEVKYFRYMDDIRIVSSRRGLLYRHYRSSTLSVDAAVWRSRQEKR